MDRKKLEVATELLLDSLSDDDRLVIFQRYCTTCGRRVPDCECWKGLE